MIFTLLITLILLAIVYDYAIKKRRNDISAGIPGPMQIPIFGNLFIFTVHNPKDLQRILIERSKLYGGFSKEWIFNKLRIILTKTEYLDIIMGSSKHIKKGQLYKILEPWLGFGLLTSRGSKWHARRKVITPAFHFKILEQFVEIFDQQSSVLVEQLRKYSVDQQAFDVYSCVTLAGLDIICETAMGVKINAQTDTNNKYAQNVLDISTIMMERVANNFHQSDFFYELLAPKTKARQDEILRELHGFTNRVIHQRRVALERLQGSKDTNGDEDDIGSKKKMALLDILLQSTINGKPLSDADICEEVDTFMFEGHDTTTSGICFTLYLISRHPDVQRKLVDEIYDVIGTDKNKPVTHADLQNLKYIECVLKESMRVHPPVPFISRELTEDTKIDKYTIPAGSEVILPIYVMLKNPEFFPDPDKFDPERHNAENTMEKVNPYSYIPFSAGPRNCIGQKFAMLEMKSTITKILRHYELLPLGEAVDPVLNLTLKSTTGFNIGIKPRRE